jgi:lysophospholipase L1-like esterase
MNTKNLKVTFVLFIILFATTSFKQDKIKILIIGDSISIGYTPFVRDNLKDLADVSHNPGNAQHTGKGLKNIEEWIAADEWDIIQFNWGLWDLCYRHSDSKNQGQRDKENGTITFSLEDYEKQLDALVKIMRKNTDAELIFVTTSYVPNHEAGRFTKDARKYNRIAKRVMKANGVKINNIYKASISIHDKYGKGDDDVHYHPQGYELLGQQIADFLKHNFLAI